MSGRPWKSAHQQKFAFIPSVASSCQLPVATSWLMCLSQWFLSVCITIHNNGAQSNKAHFAYTTLQLPSIKHSSDWSTVEVGCNCNQSKVFIHPATILASLCLCPVPNSVLHCIMYLLWFPLTGLLHPSWFGFSYRTTVLWWEMYKRGFPNLIFHTKLISEPAKVRFMNLVF